MKKITVTILIFISVLCFSCVRISLNGNIENNISREKENIDNMHTLGLVTCSDNYIFYMNYDDGPRLMKWDLRNNEKNVILNANCGFINVVDEYVYYADVDDSFAIYRVDFNGKSVKKMYNSSISSLYSYGGQLYFIDNERSYLCSMHLDGSNLKYISEDVKVYTIFENIIYYVTYDALSGKDLIRSINLYTKVDNLIGESSEVQWIGVFNNKIYFLSHAQGIYEMEIPNYKPVQIIEGDIAVNTLYLYKGILYFKDYNVGGKTRKVNLQNKQDMEIVNEKYKYITILKDRIFYYENDVLYMTYLNGRKKVKIH